MLSTLNQLFVGPHAKLAIKECATKGGRGVFVTAAAVKGEVLAEGLLPLAFTTHKLPPPPPNKAAQVSENNDSNLNCPLCNDASPQHSCGACSVDPEAFSELKQMARQWIDSTSTHTITTPTSSNSSSNFNPSHPNPNPKGTLGVYDLLIRRLTLRVVLERQRGYENTLFGLLSLTAPDTTNLLRTEGSFIKGKAMSLLRLAAKGSGDKAAALAAMSTAEVVRRKGKTPEQGDKDGISR